MGSGVRFRRRGGSRKGEGVEGGGFREVGAIDHHLILGMASEWVTEIADTMTAMGWGKVGEGVG